MLTMLDTLGVYAVPGGEGEGEGCSLYVSGIKKLPSFELQIKCQHLKPTRCLLEVMSVELFERQNRNQLSSFYKDAVCFVALVLL